MNSNNPNDPRLFLLPHLKDDKNEIPPPSEAGRWDDQPLDFMQKIAASLNTQVFEPETRQVSSIPSIWARPLLIEMALHDKNHPLRQEVIQQWEGMLTAIALAEVRGFDRRFGFQVELLELTKEKDRFVSSLLKHIPSSGKTLYTLNDRNPWEDIYVFLWNKKSVGMTSPSTLVCPSETGQWTGLDWWLEGKLCSPVPKKDWLTPQQRSQRREFLNTNEKIQLFHWLKNLEANLEYDQSNDNDSAINIILELLQNFGERLREASQNKIQLILSQNKFFFGEEINKGSLKALNYPIGIPQQESSIHLIPSVGKNPASQLLIIPNPDSPNSIMEQWKQPKHKIHICGKINLDLLNYHDWAEEIKVDKWIEEKDLLLEDLVFIKQENALPGGLLPKIHENKLKYEEQPITPLIPINDRLLDYLTPEDLTTQWVQFEQIEQNKIQVTLTLPLYGLNNGKPPQNYQIKKDYILKPENALKDLPVLEIWPNFHAENWQEYYAFYYDLNKKDQTFNVELIESQPELKLEFSEVGSYKIVKLKKFPEALKCQNHSDDILGLILLATPHKVGLSNLTKWKVGVDFGTSFTNVYFCEVINHNKNTSVPEPLKLELLHHRVTESGSEERLGSLLEYFIVPGGNETEFPLASVLTTRGSDRKEKETDRKIIDGRLYIPQTTEKFTPQKRWIHTNLKWSTENPNLNTLFLEYLALQITAQAVKSNVKEIDWFVSYPSAFSQKDKENYAQAWEKICEKLQAQTGITHKYPDPKNNLKYRTESLAVAQYFVDHQEEGEGNLDNSVCIDMGGGTSDISIWYEYENIHQCSLRLAGQNLLAQFLNQRRGLLKLLFDINPESWSQLKGQDFYSKLDVLLRLKGAEMLKTRRPQKELKDNKEFQKFLQLTRIGVAGLYYYVGLVLNFLKDKHKLTKIPTIYLGGNGSRILHWLDDSGSFTQFSQCNDLLRRMLIEGSEILQGEGNTQLSNNPKNEVAYGLVNAITTLKELSEDSYLAGEMCEINSNILDWKSLFSKQEDIKKFDVPQLVQLPKFLHKFVEICKDVKIVTSIKDYKPSINIADNQQLWDETVTEMKSSWQKMTRNSNSKPEEIRFEPPFILGLKALLTVLSKR